MEATLLKNHSLQWVVIKDPKTDHYHYLLITDYRASKKEAIAYFLRHSALKRPLIVAGDDYNDKESLEFGDVRVVMENAPPSLKASADILAPVAKHHGVIQGLNQAIELCQKEDFTQRWE